MALTSGLAVLGQVVPLILAGDQASQIAAAVFQRSVWPQLDEHLQDLDGNPVFTARMPDLEPPLDDVRATEAQRKQAFGLASGALSRRGEEPSTASKADATSRYRRQER